MSKVARFEPKPTLMKRKSQSHVSILMRYNVTKESGNENGVTSERCAENSCEQIHTMIFRCSSRGLHMQFVHYQPKIADQTQNQDVRQRQNLQASSALSAIAPRTI